MDNPYTSQQPYLNWEAVAAKWKDKWKKDHIFEANPEPHKKKFFVTFPYPYMNGYLHLGHLYTLMRVEALARYKRLQGFNVLFPQGWHCTGSPIENAAKRIREKEEKQWKIMKDQGFSEGDTIKFGEPVYWTEYFPKEARNDLETLGISVDFRRSFITTSLNPYYDRFISWQFRKLQEKGYVVKGKHPVVWDPKENMPVGDHDRIEGEGETPQEFTLLKFKMQNGDYIVAATLRPETVYGQTNLWVGADTTYVRANVGSEVWILSPQAAQKLKEQDKQITIIEEITGRSLLGKKAVAPMIHKEIPILPSDFCDPDKGTGLVTSVPSDAPDDWMGLYDIQKNSRIADAFGLDYDYIQSIKPIPIILHPELGDMAAVKVCMDLKIGSQHDREALERAKKFVYKKGFYEGTMTKTCGKYAGMSVEAAKDLVKKDLLAASEAEVMYELTGKVVSRSLSVCIVKIVSDQWFMNYSDEHWKNLVKKNLSMMKLYPDKSRAQFENVIDWISNWACTREYGLGTKLPWDHHWVIESLSDSTIYMAYYTIAHKIIHIPIQDVNDELFDYVFLGTGNAGGITGKHEKALLEMRKEFTYWYPVDFRNSGKDLIQNHLIFYLFNHTALFPESAWPRGIGVNGWVTVDGQKMSKSLGNFYLLRDLPKEFGIDPSRITILSGGEEMDDPNWETNFATSIKGRLEQWYHFVLENYHPAKENHNHVDAWLSSQTNRLIAEATLNMEETQFRSAIQRIFFEYPKVLQHYIKRSRGIPNQLLLNKAIEDHLIMMSPFIPFYCEELWERIGKSGYISFASWPQADLQKIDRAVDAGENALMTVMSDITEVLRLAKIEKPKKITLVIAAEWKYEFAEKLLAILQRTRNIGEIMQDLNKTNLRAHAGDIAKLLPRLVKDPSRLDATLTHSVEKNTLIGAVHALHEEYSCEIVIADSTLHHPKAGQAFPGKPAVIVE
jgi:leucyl-tRNA synthetase